MRRPLALIALAAAVLAAASPAAAQPTGRVLVLVDGPGEGARASAAAVMARSGARPAGPAVPEIGLVTVRPRPGRGVGALLGSLRAQPAVRSAQPEGRMSLRALPNDPALTIPETASGTPPGTTLQWPPWRQGFMRAWDVFRGAGALVGVIDTGVDGAHPELSGKVAAAIDHEVAPSPPATDTEGHGTHVASLACAATDNGLGMAGAGHHCRLLVEKTDLTDASIAASIVDAANRGAHAINMSFGDDGNRPQVAAIAAALDYAFRRGVVLVAAAADDQVAEQGQPANILQPTGTGPDLAAGRGLTVTSSTIEGQPSGAGFGTQISLAAAGSVFAFNDSRGPPGLLGAAPASRATRLDGPLPPLMNTCLCRTSVQGVTFAYLQGTSMAAPQVAAAAALVRRLNPDLGVGEVIRLLKETASRQGGWTPQLGWGVLNAGAALAAAQRVDRRPPSSRARAVRSTRLRRFLVRWTPVDRAPAGLRPSGVARVEVWRAVGRGRFRRIARLARRRTLLVRGIPGRTYSFFTVAVDRAGNREARPRRADVVTRVRR